MPVSDEFVRVARGGSAVGAPPGGTTGLEWDGNEETNTKRVLRWLSPFPCYDATYIFRIYPKGPKGGTNPKYWTTFFWGNYGTFGAPYNFYGGHPYPFDPTSGQDWEVSIYYSDYSRGPANAGNNYEGGSWTSGAATWNRWYTQVFRAFRINSTLVRNQFFYDWDLFVSSSGTAGWFQATLSGDASWGTVGNDPATPSIVIGEAPPNDGDTASWGGYTGREQFKGIIRGLQFYDARVGTTDHVPSVANLADVQAEIDAPGSVITPWYLNLNPTPTDVADKSGSGHNPAFPGSLPTLWTG